MILLTVGAQMPFDRLVMAVDEWAATRQRTDVFAQIGPSSYRPKNMEWTPFLEPAEFHRRFSAAKAIVAHAGTGTIIGALQSGKPILVLPRRASLRETRNDHQLATAEHFRKYASFAVAWDESELESQLDKIENLKVEQAVGPSASPELITALREFIAENV